MMKSRGRYERTAINLCDQLGKFKHNSVAATRLLEKNGEIVENAATMQELRRRSRMRRMRTMSLPNNAFNSSYDGGKVKRKPRYSLTIGVCEKDEHSSFVALNEEAIRLRRQFALIRFRKFVKRVLLYLFTCKAIIAYAKQKGEHDKITSDPRMRLEVQQEDLVLDKTMLFDRKKFKAAGQVYFPEWAKRVTNKNPAERTDREIDMLVHLLKQLKVFRRYSNEIQRIMCKVIKYDRFGRSRVIIRKGHVGMSFYMIYSGQVSFSLQDDGTHHQKPGKASENYSLFPGDAFGELALLREGERVATIVCRKASEFISIEKQDFREMGIMNILQKEMDSRVECFRHLDIFAAWPTDIVRKVAEEGRSMKYQSLAVIDKNISKSDMVYIVTEGRCDLLRYLELSGSKKWCQLQREQRKMFQIVDNVRFASYQQRDMTSSRLSTYSNVTHRVQDTDSVVRRYHSNPHICGKKTKSRPARMVKSAFPRTKAREATKSSKQSSLRSETQSPIRSNIAWSTEVTSRDLMQEMHWNTGSSLPPPGETTTTSRAVSRWSSSTEVHSSRYCGGSTTQSEQSVGVFMRIDVLGKHKIAGLQLVTRTDEDPVPNDTSETRQLTLVSRGCNVISVPVETLKKYADPEMIAVMKQQEKMYSNDDELLDIYAEKSNWSTYKEAVLSKTLKELEKERALSGKPVRNNSAAATQRKTVFDPAQVGCSRTATRLSVY